MWRNFRCLHMTDVEKSEILHMWHVCRKHCLIYKIYAIFIWRKMEPKSTFVENNDKYEVRPWVILKCQKWPMLPTGQWYAPSVVINDAWFCMVLHGIAWYCMVLHYLALSCTILHHLVPFCTIFHHLAPS